MLTRKKWYSEGLHFECTLCGACCGGAPGYVWVTKEQVRCIADLLGYSDGVLPDDHVRQVDGRHSLTEQPDGDCIYLKWETPERAVCGVYGARPGQCRTWPFWYENLTSRRAWDAAARNCPGMNQGQFYSFEQIERMRSGRTD